MNFNRVAIFLRVVDERGFTAAAKALGLPKSSVSRSVALLEGELGARLLLRSTRAVKLTEAGAAFYERASRGLAGVEDAAAAVADLQTAVRGVIRITAPADMGVAVLEPALARFARRHPEVHVEAVLTGRMVDVVEEGFDLALRAGAVRDGALVSRKIGQVGSGLYASPRYLRRAGTPAGVADLAGHRCVLFRASRGRATWTLRGPGGEAAVEVGGPVAADDYGFVRRAVLSGVGIGLIPTLFCERDLTRGRLVRVLPGHVSPGPAVHLAHASARYVPHRVAVFRDFLVETLSRHVVLAV
jgi:DNA-binding transcriptional LysR family regulator